MGYGGSFTFTQLEICNGLPLIRRNEPLVVFPPAAQIDDELRRVTS